MTKVRHTVADIPRAAAVRSGTSKRNVFDGLRKGATFAAAASLLGLTGVAFAQQATPGATAAPVTLQEVTVTGSRIKRTTDFTTPTPTTVIDTATMNNLGIVNVGQAITMTPANISTFTPANTGNSNFFSGAYIADLRGLNPYFGSRTLVLVDTQRFVQTTQGDSVDLNFIPKILVKRVDTVTGGASAAYGSGAIAGVVNIFLDHQLEGFKLDGDFYQTSHSDARDKHIGAAWGQGFFDNRIHVVLGGEFEKQDGANCFSRSWCQRNQGFYPNGIAGVTPSGLPYAGAIVPLGAATNVRYNQMSATGTFFNGTAGAVSTLQGSPSGTSLIPFQLGENPFASSAANQRNPVPGGQGTPIYEYSTLMAPVNRGILTGLITAKLTNSITFTGQINWGKVKTTVHGPAGLTDFAETVYPYSNPYFSTDMTNQLASAGLIAPGAFPGALPSASVNKDWSGQVPNFTNVTTTVKRFVGGLNGAFGDSSWTWDGYFEYGLTHREQHLYNNPHLYELQMAEDVVAGPNGQPECRVTADGYGGAIAANPLAGYGLAGPVLGSLLAQGCVPISPIGNQPLTQAQINYSFGPLDETLKYEQTVAALNATGNYFDGIGAGPFSLAAGIEWRQEVGHNDEVPCPAAGQPGADHCQAVITDYLIQYGQPFGGAVTVREGYLETNLPLVKGVPGIHLLDLDLAARESHYHTKALYGINVTNGVQPEFSHNLTTWKVSGNYEPTDWLRIRGSQSRDARAGNFRELYYGQIFSAGGIFGYCNPGGIAGPITDWDPCRWNLEGNVNIRPETSDTTTLGFVLTPKSVLPGFQFSADWFHIKIHNAIEQAAIALVWAQCRAGVATACSQMQFNTNYYAPGGTNTQVPAGTPGAVTGVAAWQANNYNATETTAHSYNGAFYEEKGVDISLNYLMDLGRFGTLNTRILTTWTGEQKFASCELGAAYGCYTANILNQVGTGNSFLADYTPAAKWRGSVVVTWAKGPWSLTPSMNFVGHGKMDYLGITPDDPNYAAALLNPNYLASGVALHPVPVNYVPSYFLFNLNATYNVDTGSDATLQLFAQINNIFNRTPPFASGNGAFGVTNQYGSTNPIFYDALGLAYRVGFRLAL